MLRRYFSSSFARYTYPLSKKGTPLKPYIAFTVKVRKEVEKEFPDLKVPDIGRKLGEKWRALSDHEKQKYHDEYKHELAKHK